MSFLNFGVLAIGNPANLYLSAWGDASTPLTISDVNARIAIPYAAVLRNLFVRPETPGTGSDVATFTVQVNGVDTAITCAHVESAVSSTDTTNTAIVAAGDNVRIKINAPVSVSGSDYRVVLEVQPIALATGNITLADITLSGFASHPAMAVGAITLDDIILSAVATTPEIEAGVADEACPVTPVTRQDFLDLIDRLYPDHYIGPLKDPGPGYEIIETYARLFARVSAAIAQLECDAYILHAHGGRRARATVDFTRVDTTAGAFTLKQGTRVRTSATKREFVLLSDIAFGSSDLTRQGMVESAGRSPAFNVRGPRTAANGDVLEGEIDEIVLPLQDPPFAERGLSVSQADDAVGGLAPVLDEHGLDRLIRRLPNESDTLYRGRIRLLPDTISVDAIRRQLDAIFLPRNFTYDLIETWENRLQTCWDCPTGVLNVDANLFVYDDPRDPAIYQNVWLDDIYHRASFVVVIPNLGFIEEHSMAYDDPGITAIDFTGPLGRRAHSAYDVPEFGVGQSLVLVGAYDGQDTGKIQFHLAIIDLLNKIRASGVTISLELAGE